MKLKVTRRTIEIIPEGPIDEAFLEEVIGLRQKNDRAEVVRVAPIGLDHEWAFMEIRKAEAENTQLLPVGPPPDLDKYVLKYEESKAIGTPTVVFDSGFEGPGLWSDFGAMKWRATWGPDSALAQELGRRWDTSRVGDVVSIGDPDLLELAINASFEDPRWRVEVEVLAALLMVIDGHLEHTPESYGAVYACRAGQWTDQGDIELVRGYYKKAGEMWAERTNGI